MFARKQITHYTENYKPFEGAYVVFRKWICLTGVAKMEGSKS
jgi:hypothetical protein